LAGSPVGLTLAEGKTILAAAQVRLVEAQAAAPRGDSAGIVAAPAR
jgi:hypothetical protein